MSKIKTKSLQQPTPNNIGILYSFSFETKETRHFGRMIKLTKMLLYLLFSCALHKIQYENIFYKDGVISVQQQLTATSHQVSLWWVKNMIDTK